MIPYVRKGKNYRTGRRGGEKRAISRSANNKVRERQGSDATGTGAAHVGPHT